jgi:hypothetical protein
MVHRQTFVCHLPRKLPFPTLSGGTPCSVVRDHTRFYSLAQA